MSFSKARLQRFNEVKLTPSSTSKGLSENPKIRPKLTLCDKSIDKSKSETGSSQSIPVFRTPTVLKQKLKKTVKTCTSSTPNIKEAANQNLEILREKIVECENKDAFIKDLTQQLEELKEKINQIRKDKENIENEKTKCEQVINDLKKQHEINLETIQSEFQQKLLKTSSLKVKVCEKLHHLKEDFEKFRNIYVTDLNDLKNNFGELPVRFNEYSLQYDTILKQKQAEIDHQKKNLEVLKQNSIEIEKQNSAQIENLKKEQQIEMENLEFELLKTMTNLQKEKDTCAIKIAEMQKIMDAKIEETREVFEKEKIKYQLELKMNDKQQENRDSDLEKLELEWKTKLKQQETKAEAILKECQAISEYNIIQCTLEKNAVTNDLKQTTEQLNKIKTNYEELTDDFNNLKNKYDVLESELISKKEELQAVQTYLNEEIEQYKKVSKEKSAFEYTIKNSQRTIEVLTKRLFRSDRDVEQLKEELQDYEEKMLEYEEKNAQLQSDLKHMQEFNEELEMQFESTIKLNCKDVENLGDKLLKEVDDYKKEVGLYKKKFEREEKLKKDIMLQLHEAYDMINRLKEGYENAETLCSQHKFEVEQSQNELEDYHMREMDWNIIKDKLECTVKDLENNLESKTREIAELKQQIASLKQESESISHYSEYYKQKVEELESEQRDNGKIHKKYIELSGKYDFLSSKYEELEVENSHNKMNLRKLIEERNDDNWKMKYESQVVLCKKLELENEKLKREIEDRLYDLDIKQRTPKSKKIKDDDRDTKKYIKKNRNPKEDKENMNSPNRTLNSSRIDSPLRDRN
ncbi:putative autophagy-related protein 11 [Diorhabda carinulata]|uniref:putative autophagy-related protein 11 n=1 Tax=Diorhabda carinulata TaxID=1163345 RepID=UPI0025A257C6|nr:putative autophagy-related protein 11 [Diorhabda carinulata]